MVRKVWGRRDVRQNVTDYKTGALMWLRFLRVQNALGEKALQQGTADLDAG